MYITNYLSSYSIMVRCRTLLIWCDRKEFPLVNDEEWSKVNWDYFQDCFTCDSRHRCGQTLSREHYRKAADLIICSQDFLWIIFGRTKLANVKDKFCYYQKVVALYSMVGASCRICSSKSFNRTV